AVETTRAQQRGVEHVGPVGGRDQDDALVGLEAVHLDQQLVEGLLALVVAAAEARAAMASDRVDLVDEDDAGRVLLPLHEEVAHARGADADEHLDEVGARDGEERHARLARDTARQERLAGSRRSDQEHALRDAAAELGELLRILQERDDLFELFLRLVDARDVGEGDLVLVLGEQLRPALAERHRLAASDLHLPHEEDPDADEQQHWRPLHERDHVPGLRVLRPRLDLDSLLPQHANQVGVLRREGLEAVAGFPALRLVPAPDALALDHDLGNPAFLHRLHEASEGDFWCTRLLLADDGPEDQPHQEQQKPKPEITRDRVQRHLDGWWRNVPCGFSMGNARDPYPARSKIPRTTSRVCGPTAAPVARATPGTQTISPATTTRGSASRASRGTLASTRTSWSFRVPTPGRWMRSPGQRERKSKPPRSASASNSVSSPGGVAVSSPAR